MALGMRLQEGPSQPDSGKDPFIPPVKMARSRVVIYCTVPPGSGTNAIGIITLDGQATTVTRQTGPSAVYADMWFDSGQIANIQHTITIANGGSSSDSPLMFDRFHVEGDTILNSTPVAPAPPPSPTVAPQTLRLTSLSVSVSVVTTTVRHSSSSISSIASSRKSSSTSSSSSVSTNLTGTSTSQSSSTTGIGSSADKTVTSIQFVTTAADGNVATQSVNPAQEDATGSSSTNVGAIAGGVIAGIVLIIAFMLFLLCLRRRRRSCGAPFMQLNRSNTSVVPRRMTDVTPFQRASQLEQPPEQQDPEMSEVAPASSTSDHHDNGTVVRRFPEKNPAYYGSNTVQSPVSLDTYARNRLQAQYGDILDHQSSSSMYATTIYAPPESSNRPPSYQSARPPGSATRRSFPHRDEKNTPPIPNGS
ncbi:hypothetical protein JR316_0004087 [Psilocybe cubensis]|uniref:Uncharacterized protein n=2 Tax=Psilocybe cubensis TaxID=181762 RepID=A0ACB8HA57_PSICU|nr:hypothetical protein JR316_0004087 [Psilocybe cubensis]KAH9484605.1 hypothetical protein JR316_0004087 [Psilocybe cubensis]